MAQQVAQQLADILQPRSPVEPPGLRPGITLNGYFGRVTQGPGGGKTDYNVDTSRDFVYRHLGVTKDLLHRLNIQSALTNPTQYIEAKNADELRIADSATDQFRNIFQERLRLGDTAEDAEKKGLAGAKGEYERKMKDHNQRFPTDITRKLADKLL